MYNLLIAYFLLFLDIPFFVDTPQRDDDPVIYLLPGQGADCRLFKNIDFPYDTVHLEFPIPDKKTTLREYAYSFLPRIDTSRCFILIGVSLGGMISSELADTLNPEKVIVISGAKCRDADHTLPIKNISCDYLLPGGTHMMVYIRGDEVSELINKILIK